MDEAKKICERAELKRARRSAGLTQTRLAKNLRVTTSAVSAWESGIRKPSDEILPKLAEELEVPVGTLIDWIDNPAPAPAGGAFADWTHPELRRP